MHCNLHYCIYDNSHFYSLQKDNETVEIDKQETDLTGGKGSEKIDDEIAIVYIMMAKRENARREEYHDYSDRDCRDQDSQPNDTPQNLDDTASCSPCSFIRFNGAFAGRPVTPR